MQYQQPEIWQAFLRASRAIRHSHGALARSLVVPVLVLAALAFAKRGSEAAFPDVAVVLTLVGLIVYAIIAVRVHRVVLLGPAALSRAPELLPSLRDVKYAATLVVISLLAGAPLLLAVFATTPLGGAALSPWIAGLGSVLALYLVSRFSLVLPSIAVDDSLQLFRAFAVSRPHHVSLFFAVGVMPVTLAFAVQLAVVAPLSLAFGDVAAGIGGWLAFVPAMIVEIALLSGLFQLIRESRVARVAT